MSRNPFPARRNVRVPTYPNRSPPESRSMRHALPAFLFATLLFPLGSPAWSQTEQPERHANRPQVPGVLRLELRERQAESNDAQADDPVKVFQRTVNWEASKTAIIICDMWDGHYCRLAAQRVGVMAPRMNEVLSAARSHGVMIIHAPSGTVDVYAETPYRQRMQQAVAAEPPVPIAGWCYLDPEHEAPLPIDDSRSPCDDPIVGAAVKQFSRQHPALDIIGFDGISDSGQEIYNFCRQEGIENIAIMGVHTNMCVLGRSFGIRQLVRLGMNVALVRDMTDAMYDPRERPYVSHARGTELVVEHIERYWCPSILSRDLTLAY
jgi:nicotinamidase-related amidase